MMTIESVLCFFCIWGHGHSWRLRFQRKNRRQLIISQTTGTKIQNLSSFALTLDSFNSFTFQIVSGFSNPQGSLAFQRRNSWNVKTFALLQFSTLKVNYQDWPSDLSGHSIFDFTHELRQQAVFEANLLIGGQLSWQRGDKMQQWNQLILDS